MIIFFAIILALYGSINYYIFIRGWQALSAHPTLRIYYLVFFVFAALAYLLAKLLADYMPSLMYDIFLWVGSFWFAFMAYFLLAVIDIDIFRLVCHIFNLSPAFIYKNYEMAKQVTMLVVIIVVSVVVLLGYLNTRNIVVNTTNTTLPKGAGKLDELNVVMVSDIHISPVNDGKLLTAIVDKINSLNPDIVLFAGDIVDDKANILKERNIGSEFGNLKSKYGTYAITGNHEFIIGADDCVSYIKEFGINVLRDSSILIDDSFYIIGREDRSKNTFNSKRKDLPELMKSVQKNYSTILLDHTPFNLEEAEQNGISLQFSGHTHHGQIFFGNLITQLVYELSWGYLKKGNTQYYVSCGVGTWGPPVRSGSQTEIVNFKIKFR
jgi:predicted MPP superfamily phosphohydrolase